MRFLTLKNGLLIGLVMVSLVFISAKTYSTDESRKEVLLVETYGIAGLRNLYVYHKDRPTEVLGLRLLSKKNIESNGRLIQSKFQELYEQGWELQGVSSTEIVTRYIMVR